MSADCLRPRHAAHAPPEANLTVPQQLPGCVSTGPGRSLSEVTSLSAGSSCPSWQNGQARSGSGGQNGAKCVGSDLGPQKAARLSTRDTAAPPVAGSWDFARLIVWRRTVNFCFLFLKGCSSRRLWKTLSFTVGGTIALCVGLLTSVYLATLHENDLWFSNIKVRGFYDHCVIYSLVYAVHSLGGE